MKAREAKNQEGYSVTYKDVIEDPQTLEEMLQFTDGTRKVPVLVEAGKVTIGFGGT